jgi:uncharacterized protein YxjI
VYCPRCGSPISEGAQFCTGCGNRLGSGVADVPLASAPLPNSDSLTSVPRLVLLRDKLAIGSGFQIQDPSGTPLGEIPGSAAGLLSGLTLLGSDKRVVLRLRAGRGAGLRYGVMIQDASGETLAVMQPMTGLGSQKWEVSVGMTRPMVLKIDLGGLRYHLEDASTGKVVASADRQMAVRTSRTDVQVTEVRDVDRRIVIGSMIAGAFISIRGSL